MAVLGRAIASYLSRLGGLYSVALPESLSDELTALVRQANQLQPNRAIFVCTSAPPTGLAGMTTTWREILAWRTMDDRIFAWQRGLNEPDSSFQSVVRPFISSRFPGAGGGECSSSLLVRIGLEDIWSRRGWQAVGDVFTAFIETAEWVFDVLVAMFEDAGSTAGLHWSDRFVEHWAQMLDRLESSIGGYPQILVPRHAWEVVRLSGLPLPSAIVSGNPLVDRPKVLPEKDRTKLAKLWDDIVSSFLLRDGGISELLSALDRKGPGPAHNCAWRGMDWSRAQDLSLDTPGPVVGARVLGCAPSPSLICQDIPSGGVITVPSWWGVSTDDLDAARTRLREQTALLPDPSQHLLLRAFGGNSNLFVVDTRAGTISHAHTPAKWRARVTMPMIRLRFKEDWNALHVSALEPSSADDGDAWINPDAATVKLKGASTDNPTFQATAGDQLLISFSMDVEYQFSRDRQSGVITGAWGAQRSLVVTVDVRSRLGGQWERSRKVEVEIEVVVPSPLSPTVMIAEEGRVRATGPDTQDKFTANPSVAGAWECDNTPTLLLNEEGRYQVAIYDGTLAADVATFRPLVEPWISDVQAPAPSGGLFPPSDHDLDDGVTVSDHASEADILVFSVKERSANLSSGLLSAVRRRPAGRRPPATAARNSLLGQYQDSVTQAICGATTLNSLFQFVVAASPDPISWPTHPGGRPAELLFDHEAGLTLPGISNGPSEELAARPAWLEYMSAVGHVCGQLGLHPQNANAWLSGLDVNVLTGESVRRLLYAHAALIDAAESVSSAATLSDRFWASFPFSIVVVEGRQTADFGQLRAVFLSPLHPARLAWSFAVTKVARNSKADEALLGLLEGWNIPCAGVGVNAARQPWPLAAVPIDPGIEQDFAAWSALAILGQSGVADLPLLAGGQPLPWGGRTGINARVVERAIGDYLVVHPHVNALEVDVRSVGPAPRSREIDESLLRLVGAADMDAVSGLGGVARIWDSLDRQGAPPTRDMLFAARRSIDAERAFEWRGYASANRPQDADVALVENATVHLAIVPGTAHGVLGLLPLKRFSPSDLQEMQFDQNFVTPDGEDLLGLSGLLRRIEGAFGQQQLAIRALAQGHSLGIGLGAQWEVLGTFNLDPSVLATLVTSAPQQGRLLWEWRPSWMPTEKAADLAKRPYFVVARIPASLSMALHARQAITTANANQLLRVLGRRGIGLSVLSAEGGTQESAAAGYFYAIQLLSPASGHVPFDRLPSEQRPAFYGVLPVDPIEPILQGLAGKRLDRRADLLAIAASWRDDGSLAVCIVPVEIKHHGMPGQPEEWPGPTHSELKRAREQLRDTVKLFQDIAADLAATAGADDCAGHCLKRLAFATLIDLAMSFAAAPASPSVRSRVLAALLEGPFRIGVGDPALLWFAPNSITLSGSAYAVDPHEPYRIGELQAREVYMDPCAVPAMWWDDVAVGPTETAARTEIDQALLLAFSQCARMQVEIASERQALAALVGLGAEGSGERSSSDGDDGESDEGEATQEATSSTQDDESSEPDDEPSPEESAELQAAEPENEQVAEEMIRNNAAPPEPPPRAAVGWTELGHRYAIVGKLASGGDTVAIDLDHPKTIGIFGYMGSGKSYLLGTLIESALVQIPGINLLPAPLAVVIFNYRRNASDRFELASLAVPNNDPTDVARLAAEYGAQPLAIPDIRVLCLPGELRPPRRREYGSLTATELYFAPAALDVEDWELLMGEPGSDAVFARTIRAILGDLRLAGDISLDALDREVTSRLTAQSRNAAKLRIDFVRRYISSNRGADFADLIRPGRALIVDLRQPLFNKDDALRFFLVCANQISRVQGRFNKLIVFDEAHEYLSEAFGERMEARIRLMRHEGTSYVFATQDVASIPTGVSRFLTTRFVFNLGTRENVHDLEQVAPDFRGMRLLDLRPGQCLLQANSSLNGFFQRPREILVRPRVTLHGGVSQIFPGAP
jgi:hypothetical protein